MNLSTPVREHLNPWAAFCLVGVLQGGVYGQANIYFVKQLNIGVLLQLVSSNLCSCSSPRHAVFSIIGKHVSYSGIFRGFGFAGVRDTLSQGIPYVFSETVQKSFLDPLYDTSDAPGKHCSVLFCSMIGVACRWSPCWCQEMEFCDCEFNRCYIHKSRVT